MAGERVHYHGIDFLRALSCLAIISMHIKANTEYHITGFLYETFVSSWTQLVYLFLMISGFAMCCGYYEKVRSGKVDFNTFYGKRYKKTLPFFAFLLLIAIVMERSPETFMEAAAESTLMFGLLPNNELGTIGVSWTLGVIFLFYFLFPFIVFLTYTRKRAVLVFGGSLVMNYLCVYYFFTEKFVIPEFSFRHSFIYCLPYFLGGVLIYLYRDKLRSFVSSHRILSFAAMLICIIAYYIIPDEIGEISLFTPKNLLVSTVILIYAIGAEGKLSNNKAVAYLSAISMEMYLCQMILFRGAEKLHLLYIAGDGWVSFILCNIIVIAMIIIFCAGFRFGWDWLEKKILPKLKQEK